jgi:hypothetical protein
MWDRFLTIIDMVLSHWRLLMLLFFAGGLGHFAEDGIDYAKSKLSEERPPVVDEATVQPNVEPAAECPIQACPEATTKIIERETVIVNECNIKEHIAADH